MDSTFIYIIISILTVAVLWGAYEIYKIRQATQDVAVELHEAAVRDITGTTVPVLFDQEAQ